MTETNGKPVFNDQHAKRIEQLVEQFVVNQTTLRANLFRKLTDDPRRSLDDECGYPHTSSLDAWYYKELYDREPLAARVVQVMPKESWQVSPEVYEKEDEGSETEFEKAWDKLTQGLRGSSWFMGEAGNPIWDYLRRADILSGIGHFGVLLLGIDDGKPLDQPIDGMVTVNYENEAVTKLVFNHRTGKTEQRQVGVKRRKVSEEPLMPDSPITNAERDRLLDDANCKKAKRQPPTEAQRKLINSWTKQPTENVVTHADQLSGTQDQYYSWGYGPTESQTLPDKGNKQDRKLLFLRPFDETLVQVVRYEYNTRNPRCGQPVMYQITMNDPREQMTGIGMPQATVMVHWSRVIHLADNRGASECIGVPRMRQVLNCILDARKVRGAGAEGYWKSCFTGLQFTTHSQLGGDVEVNMQEVKDTYEQYINGLQRGLVGKGGEWKTLAPSVVDPTPHRLGCIEDICIQIPCPKRVFMGSERGELASTQDDSQWNDQLRQRENGYITPFIICPLIDRLIIVGCLPEPGEDGYGIDWPDLDSLSDTDKANIALILTQAIAAYVAGNVEALLEPINYLTKVIGWEQAEVEAFLEAAAKAQEEKQADAEVLADEQGMIPEAPPGFQQPEPEKPMPPVKVKPGEKLVDPKKVVANLAEEFGLTEDEQRQLLETYV